METRCLCGVVSEHNDSIGVSCRVQCGLCFGSRRTRNVSGLSNFVRLDFHVLVKYILARNV